MSRAGFDGEVREALDRLYEVAALQTQRLANLAPRRVGLGIVSPGEALHQALLEGIEACAPRTGTEGNSRIARHYRALALRYVEGKEPAEAQREVGLSRSQYYRELQSAIHGLAALLWERWGLDAQPDAPDPGGAVPADLFRRHVLVGRDPELLQLQRAFNAALAGEGSLVAVVGEPGIGKTALTEQLATYAATRGGRALVGHSYQPGSLALPYLPFVEALRSYAGASETVALAQELGPDAAELARIVPELRDRLGVEPRAPGDPDEDRWRLYQALADLLQRASARHPLLICLEDLHWADGGTLDLLVYLAHRLRDMRVLVVVNCRDAEVDRGHLLTSALAESRRVPAFQHIRLRGLSADHVHALLGSLAGRALSRDLADAVYRQTEGNPLFVRELVRHLAEKGLLDEADRGQGARSVLRTQQIPEGLRDVIRQRLSRLSPATNQVLAIAGVLGREFTLATLQAVGDLTDETVEGALQEAVRSGLLEDHSRAGLLQFRFAHAFFRQTLYEDLFSARRLRLHQRVARVLERLYADHLEEHAAELAEHFAQSVDPTDLRKAVQYGKLAAECAVRVSAYGEAARLLEQALLAQDVLDSRDPGARCDLLLALGEALGPGDPRRTQEEVAEEAHRLAEALGDADRAARASALAIDALMRQAGGVAWGVPAFHTWAERADRHAAPGTAARVGADIAVGQAAFGVGDWEKTRATLRRALNGARALGHARTLFDVGAALGPGRWWPGDEDDLVALSRELTQLPIEGVPARILSCAYCFSVAWLVAAGDRPAAEDSARWCTDVAERSRDPRAVRFAIENDLLFATLDGDFAGVQIAGERLRALGGETGSSIAASFSIARSCAPAWYYLGRARDVVQAYDELREQWSSRRLQERLRRGIYAVHADASGRNVAALREVLAEQLSSSSGGPAPATLLTDLLEAAVAVKDRDACAALAPLLSGLAGFAVLGAFNPTTPGRHLGDAARLLSDRERARAYYETAIEATARVRHRPELALIRLRLAELLLDGSPRERIEAQHHLGLAIPELDAMAMRPFLERARAIQGSGVR